MSESGAHIAFRDVLSHVRGDGCIWEHAAAFEESAQASNFVFVLRYNLVVALFETVNMFLHQAHFVELLCDPVLHLIALTLKVDSIITDDLKLMADEIKQI